MHLPSHLPVVRAALALGLALATSGCATTRPERALDEVATTLAQRGVPGVAAHPPDAPAAGSAAPDGSADPAAPTATTTDAVATLLAAPLTADSAAAIAVLRSPVLQATLAEIGIAQAELAEATRLANPGISFARTTGGGERTTTWGLAADVVDWLTQPLRRQLGEAELERAKLEVGAAILDEIAAVKSAFVAYQAAEEMVARLGTIEALARAAFDYAAALHAAGNLTALERANAEASWHETHAELLRARADATGRREEVVRALGLAGDETWRAAPLPGEPTLALVGGPAEPDAGHAHAVPAEPVEEQQEEQLAHQHGHQHEQQREHQHGQQQGPHQGHQHDHGEAVAPPVDASASAPVPSAAGTPESALSVASLEERALAERLDLAAARWAVDAIERARGLRQVTRWLPVGIEIGVEREREREQSSSGGVDRVRLTGASVELALPIFDTGAASLARLDAELRRARWQELALAGAIRSEVRLRAAELAAARELAVLHRERIVPLRREVLARTLREYNQMIVGTFDVLAARSAEIAAERAAVEAVAAAWAAHIALERAVGGPLEGPSETSAAQPAAPAAPAAPPHSPAHHEAPTP
jgi:outer membrane protein TolC